MKPCFISNSVCDETHALITISGHQKKKTRSSSNK